MTVRSRALLGAGVVGLTLALAPLLYQPVLAIALVCAVVVAALASRSVAYPVALAGLPAVAIGLAGGQNPLPQGVVTKFLAAWVALGILLAVVRNDEELPLRVLASVPVILTILLAVWMLARLGVSLDPSYGSRKLQLFISGNVLLLFAGLLIARDRARFELYVFLALLMAVLSSLAISRGLLSGASANVGGRFSLTADDSPIGLGRDAARGILIAVFVLLAAQRNWLRVLAFGALPLVAVALIASGSRGPLVGLAAGLVALVLLTVGDREARRRSVLVIAGVFGAVLLVPQLVPGQDIGRAFSIFSGRSEGLSSNGRSALWHQAWQLFNAHPIAGAGTGSFGFVEPVELFPHNIVLETAAELGVVGALLTIGFLVATAALAWRAWRMSEGEDRAHAAIILSLFVAALTNAMLSSDITANQALWLVGGLSLGLSRRLDLALPVPVAAMRGLRRTPRAERTARPPRPMWPERKDRPVAPGPRIVEPLDGASVTGVVQVQVAAQRRPLDAVRIEWSAGGGWSPVAERDERAFEIRAGTAEAVVRSQWLADLFAAALGTSARRSRRRPWAAPAAYAVEWDTTLVPPGEGRIRAVTVDTEGRALASDEVRVTVEPLAAAAQAAEDPATAIVRRIRGASAAAARLAERESELELWAAEVAREQAALAARNEALLADRASLDDRLEELAAREAGVADSRATLQERAAAVNDERARLARERSEVESAREQLAARERAVAEAAARAVAQAERGVRALRLAPVAGSVRGHIALEVHAANVAGAVTVEAERRSGWAFVSQDVAALDTTVLPEGRSRIRARADGAVSEPIELLVDNRPPAVRIVAPPAGSVVAGVVTPVVEASDEGTGVRSVLLQRSRDGSTWRPIAGTAWSTDADEDGEWLLRATAVDETNNVGRSEIVRVLLRNVEPAPTPPPPPGRRPTLFDLSSVAARVQDPLRRDELEALLFQLRDYADVDGVLPLQFDALIDEEFGEIVRSS